MPKIKSGTIAQYMVSGKQELLDSAKRLVAAAETRDDALVNLTILECESKSYFTVAHSRHSYLARGLFGGGAAGMLRALVTSESLVAGVGAGVALGGSAALMVDKIEDCLIKARESNRNTEILQLIDDAKEKLSLFENKPAEQIALRK